MPDTFIGEGSVERVVEILAESFETECRMSRTIDVNRDRGFILVHYETPTGVGEIIDTFEEILEDKELLSIPWRIHDLRLAPPNFESTELRAIAGRAELNRKHLTDEQRQERRVAAILPEDLGYGLGRMLEVFMQDDEREAPQFRVFRSFAMAVEWIGLGSDYPDPYPSEGLGDC